MSTWGDPIGATGLWYRVTERQQGVCHCTGQCGRKHTKTEGFCDHRLPWDRIVVAPTDASISAAEAFLVPETELTAWCEPCLDGARAIARRVEREHRQTESLFNLPEAS